MTFRKIYFTILLILCGVLYQAHAQEDCVPLVLQFVQIFPNATLRWGVNPLETCEITEFQVDIMGDREDEYYFKVIETFVDLSFLEICEMWDFRVIPISHGISGMSRTLRHYIPVPPDADLSLSHFNVTALGGREAEIQWKLNEGTPHDCTLQYRLSIYDEDLGLSFDRYFQKSPSTMTFESPCVSYELGMRTVNSGNPTTEGPEISYFFEIAPTPQKAPVLNTLDIQATSISMTWRLEGNANRCPLRALYLDAGNHFNISVPLMNEIDPEPVLVELKSLQPNTMYYMRVYVENSGGVSAATPIAVQTLELSPD